MKIRLSTLTKLLMASVIALAAIGVAPVSYAKNGADDPAGHNAGDDRGGHSGRG